MVSPNTDRVPITPPVIAEFYAVHEPSNYKDGAPKYTIRCLLTQEALDSMEWNYIEKRIQEKALEKGGPKALQGLAHPLNYEHSPEKRGWPSNVVAYFNSSASVDRPPLVISREGKAVAKGEMYRGIIVRISLNPYYYDKMGRRGVGLGLVNVQVLGGGTRLTSAHPTGDEFGTLPPLFGNDGDQGIDKYL
jgi:hypothetical protein